MTAPVNVTNLDRTLAAMRAIVSSFIPALKYYGAHEYSVQECDGATFSGVPTDPGFSPPLPTRVPFSPSLAGSYSVVPVGAIAHVLFVNSDPTKPRCIGFDLPTLPASTNIDAGAINLGTYTARVVREGDIYSLGTAVGRITLVSVGGTDPKPTKVLA